MRKETVDIDILITPSNGDRKVLQPIRITSGPATRRTKWNQFMQFRSVSMKVIPIEKVQVVYISTMSQGFKKSSKLRTNTHNLV